MHNLGGYASSIRVIEHVLRSASVVLKRVVLINIARCLTTLVKQKVPTLVAHLTLCGAVQELKFLHPTFHSGKHEFHIGLLRVSSIIDLIEMPYLIRI